MTFKGSKVGQCPKDFQPKRFLTRKARILTCLASHSPSDAALNLINKSGTIFSLSTNNGLLSFLFEVQSTPQVIDQVLDSQRIVDNKIKNLCELFIDYSVRLILRRLQLVRNQLVNCSKVISNENVSFKSAAAAAASTEKGTPLDTTGTVNETRAEHQASVQQTDPVENRIETMDSSAQVTSGEQPPNTAERVDSIANAPDGKLQENDSRENEEDAESKNGTSEQRTNDTSSVSASGPANGDHPTAVAGQHSATSANTSGASEQRPLAEQADSQLSSVQQLANDLNELIREANEQVISVQKSMKVYLSSEDTEAILFKPVKNHIVKSIENLFSQLALVFTDQELACSDCPYTSPKAVLEAIFRTNRTADRPNW